jgi:F0F1-type ATP synthase assembly protein I
VKERNDGRPRAEGASPLRFVGIGFEIVTPLLVGVFGGRLIDRHFGTAPWFLLGGALLGGAAGMLNFIRRVLASGRSGAGTS